MNAKRYMAAVAGSVLGIAAPAGAAASPASAAPAHEPDVTWQMGLWPSPTARTSSPAPTGAGTGHGYAWPGCPPGPASTLSAAGGLQVSLGRDYSSAHCWLSRDARHFVPAPLLCPAQTTALLGWVRRGKPTALCSGPPSDVDAGQNDKQVWIAPYLGGRFHASGPVLVSHNTQGFAAASDRTMTVATQFTLSITTDAGRSWHVLSLP